MEDNMEGAKECIRCEEVATIVCFDCKTYYCEDCFNLMHQKKKTQSIKMKKLVLFYLLKSFV